MNLNLQKIFDHNQTLFIGGETGVGKSTKARDLSGFYKKQGFFLGVNLATLGESLFESQFFGHKKGSFTGADKDHRGFLEQVGTGVLFLDEIGELSLNLQKKLLAVLEEKIFFPVGSNTPKEFKGMLILATHQDLRRLVASGLFRSDLYFRISRFEINLSPLRQQREAIRETLAAHETRFAANVFTYLCEDYSWPGNFRELKNLIQLLEFSEGKKIEELSELPIEREVNQSLFTKKNATGLKDFTYVQAFNDFERDFFSTVMKETEGRVNHTAEQLGISKTTLIAKLKKYGISSLQIRAMSHAV